MAHFARPRSREQLAARHGPDLRCVAGIVDRPRNDGAIRRRQWAGLINGKSARGPRFAVQTPIRHVGLKRGLEGRKQTFELFQGQTGEIQEIRNKLILNWNNLAAQRTYR